MTGEKPKVPLFLPGDGPLDAEFVESLWMEACIEGKSPAACYLQEIRNCLLGLRGPPREWDLALVIEQLHEVFGYGRSLGIIENILLMTDSTRGSGFQSSVIAVEFTRAVLRGMVVAVVPGSTHHHPFPLH